MTKKRKPIKVVYNNQPDPVVKITEFEYTGEGLKKVSEKTYVDKPEPGKQYSLTAASGTNSIANGNSWKESEVK